MNASRQHILHAASLLAVSLLLVLGAVAASFLDGALVSLHPTAPAATSIGSPSPAATAIAPASATATNPASGSLLPTLPSGTRTTPTVCVPPADWIGYVIQPGDTLFRIASSYGLDWQTLMMRNCLSDDEISAGQLLLVPYWPSRTPSPSATATASATPTASPTATGTNTPTATSTP